MWTSCPTSRNTQAMPVSWQMGVPPPMASFSRMRSRISRAAGQSSASRAAAMACVTSSVRWVLARMHSRATASVTAPALSSRIFHTPFPRPRVPRGALSCLAGWAHSAPPAVR